MMQNSSIINYSDVSGVDNVDGFIGKEQGMNGSFFDSIRIPDENHFDVDYEEYLRYVFKSNEEKKASFSEKEKQLIGLVLPDCEFRIDVNPTEWLSEKAIKELGTLGEELFDKIHYETKLGAYLCNSTSNYGSPDEHYALLWRMIFEYGDKREKYMRVQYDPTEDEKDVFRVMNVLLLENAYCYVRNLKSLNEGVLVGFPVFSEYDLPVPESNEFEKLFTEINNKSGYGHDIDYKLAAIIISKMVLLSWYKNSGMSVD